MLGFFKKVNPQAAAGKARDALNAGRASDAAAVCEAALKVHPHHADCRTLLARAYEQLGRVGDAIEAYEAACAKAPSYPNLLACASLYARVGDWDQAEAKFQAAVEKFPTSVPAWQGLADARERLGKLDLVVGCREMLASLQPDDLEAQLGLAEAGAAAGDAPKASEIAQAVLDGDPNNVRALHCLANCLAIQRCWDDAVHAFKRLLKLLAVASEADDAERARIHYDLAAVLRRVGNHDEALAHLQACQEVQPTFLPAYRAAVELHRLKNDLPSAVAVTERALEIQPSEPAIWLDLGRLHLAAADARAAMEAFARALELKPGYTEAIAGSAEAMSAAGQHDRARALCEKLTVKRAFQPLPHLTYARVLRNAGALRDALHQVETALGLDASSAEATKLRRELLEALGRPAPS